jgi:hypothetical protein
MIGLLASRAAEVFPSDTDWRYLKGTVEASQPDSTAWRRVDFDDSGWLTGRAPFFYEDQPGTGTAFTGNTELRDMRNNYTCIFLRKTFVVRNPADVSQLEIQALSDDGFITWINNHDDVMRFNMGDGEIPYDGTSLPALPEPIAVQTKTVDNAAQYLVPGTNVIAVQAFNCSKANSSDFVIWLALSSSVDDVPPMQVEVIPPAGATVRALTTLEVTFSEGVTGVDATDLLVNGAPATNVTTITAAKYVFEFGPPAIGQVQVAWSPAHGIRDLASNPNDFAGGNWSYILNPNAPLPGVVISEFVADNDKTLNDEDGDDSDWIELYNSSSTTASLFGWYLTDQTNVLARWRFQNVSLPARSYLIVYASGKNRTEPTSPLHADFKLAKEGGYLALVDPATNVVSDFFPRYPRQYTDVSYGRDSLAPELVGYFLTPTPGKPNASGGPDFSPDVEFSQPGGSFYGSLTLSLSTSTTNAVIRYTVDGTIPAPTSPAYGGPLTLTNTTLVRARTYAPGLLPGRPRSESYFALNADVLNYTSDLPIIVLHNLGKGAVPASVFQPVMVQVFEPKYGKSSLTNAPDLTARAGFHLRGSSTLYYSKGSFSLETRDEFDNDEKMSLLGLPKESDWVLYAPNSFEPVLLHNPVAHELSRQMGQYSSRTRFAVVYLNTAGGPVRSADYNGIYVLEEKIKVNSERVAVAKLAPEHVKLPKVTGGYLLSVDRGAPGESQFSAGGQGYLNYLDPSYEEIMTPQRAPQRQYIKNYLDTLGTALNSAGFTNPVTGYAAYIDVAASLDHHIQNVVTFNVDGMRLSGYFYKPREGKVIMGPCWDYDRTQGSTDGRDFNPRVWRSRVPDYGTDMFNSDSIYNNPWYSRMFRDIDYWQKWIDRYQDLRQGVLSYTNVAAIINTLANQVRQEQPRELKRWGVRPRSGNWSAGGYSYRFSGNWQGEVDWMKFWYSERLNFIDTNLLARPALDSPGGPIQPGFNLRITGPPGANLYYTLDGTDPRSPGGSVSPKATLYTGPLQLEANARVAVRARNDAHRNLTGSGNPPLSSPWSGVAAATFAVQTPLLVITELMYHPSLPPGSTNDPGDFEYIELKNVGTNTLSLPGFRLTNGITFTFTATNAITSLSPGEFVLLVKDLAAFARRYPKITNVAGQFDGSLDNAGERLYLEGPLKEPILDFSYDNTWYPITDGPGFSLVIRDENARLTSWTNQFSWRPSAAEGGSPGETDLAPVAVLAVRVNEALTHTDPPRVDTVELYNPDSAPADIGGWFLSDDFGTPKKYVFPPRTIIPSRSCALFDESVFNLPGLNGFSFSSLGDQVYLFSGDGSNLTGYYHGFQFEAAFEGVTFGRYVTSTGAEHFVAQRQPTLGGPNTGPRIGPVVISEIMYNPPPIGTNNNTLDEFVELQNLTSQPVPLHDSLTPANGWRVDGGIQFEFPAAVTLEPNGYLLLVNFDPNANRTALAAFQNKYGVEAATRVLGPYRGNLENRGERVGLYRPDAPQGPLDPHPGEVPYVLVDQVRYSNLAPWPTAADGAGKSLQRVYGSQYGDDPVNWQAADPTAGKPNPTVGEQDTDQDGLPDAWEIQHSLRPDDPTGVNGALGDPDEDGLGNLAEYVAGTDPRDAASCLQVSSADVNGGVFVLRFVAVAGKTYSVLYCDSLEQGTWLRLTDVPAQASTGEVEVTDSDGPGRAARFYRLVTPAQSN